MEERKGARRPTLKTHKGLGVARTQAELKLRYYAGFIDAIALHTLLLNPRKRLIPRDVGGDFDQSAKALVWMSAHSHWAVVPASRMRRVALVS